MKNEDFLKVNLEDKVKYILSIEDYQEQQKILEYLKLKDKFTYIKVSAKVKTIKSNPKSLAKKDETKKEGIEYIAFNKIKDNPYQPRLYIEKSKVEELATSIKERGLLQPLVVNKSSEDTYELIAGHTRRDALLLNGERTAKSIVFTNYSLDNKNYKNAMLSNAIVENIHRNNLDPIESAISFKNALEEGIYSNQADLAKAIGKQKIYITKILSILKLHVDILTDLKVNKSTKDIQSLYFIQRIPNEEIQKEMYFNLINQKINRADIIEYVKSLKVKTLDKSVSSSFIYKKNKLEIKSDFTKLTVEKKELFENELTKLIDKYI